MNDEQPQEIQPSEPDEKIAAPPAPPQPGKWQMPKPVFKKTSGYLPQGFERAAGFGQNAQNAGSAPAPAAAPSAAPAAEGIHNAPVEAVTPVEQPDFIDEFDDEQPIVAAHAAPAKQSSSAARILLALVIFFVVVGFIAGFLYLIYFLFLSEGAASL